jgi:hypothetical protein
MHHRKKNNEKLEQVQRRAALFVTNNYNTTSSVTSVMERFEWEKLSQRRKAKATMMYRVIHSLVAILIPNFTNNIGASTRGHTSRYKVPFCRTTIYKESFFPSTIRIWNQLPESTISAMSLDTFKIS